MTPPSATPRLGAALRWLTLVLVFLASAEIFLRVDDAVTWGAPLGGPYSEAWLTTQDSLGPHGRPGYRYQKWGMNRAGFRGPELAPTPPPRHTTRIAILGASETFGLYETEGAEYPARMQAILDSVAPDRFEVVNAALPGMMLPTMITYYERIVDRIHPQVVFVYPSPTFYLSDPPPTVPVDSAGPGGDVRAHPRKRSFHVDVRLPAKSREVLKQIVPPFAVTAYREWRLEQVRRRHAPQWVWTEVPQDRIALFAQHLERLVTAIQARGVKVVLVTHTNRFIGMSPAQIPHNLRHVINLIALYHQRATPQVMMAIDSAANAVVRRVAERRHATVVEAEGRIPPAALYFADYAHFTDAGADRMARLLVPAALAATTPEPSP